MITGADLIFQHGLTRRQLSFWTQQGYIRPVNPNPGTGRDLEFTLYEAINARLMVELTTAGFTAKDAARIARNRAEGAETLRRLAVLIGGPA